MSSPAGKQPSDRQPSRGTDKFQPSPDGVYNQIGGEAVLINMKTNRIYELNETSGRLWELLCAGKSLEEIRQVMLQEYDVEAGQLAAEVDGIIISLEQEQLITPVS